MPAPAANCPGIDALPIVGPSARQSVWNQKEIEITDGREDGDRAWIQFSGRENGAAIAGDAELHREDGRWYVSSINIR